MEDILSFIISPSFTGWLLFVKIGFVVLALGFVSAIVFILFRTEWIRLIFLQDLVEFFTYRPYGVRKIAKAWDKIIGRLEAGLESEYKLAVIEADNLLDGIIKRIGFGGETLADRLDQITSATLTNLDQVREAHKLRNTIVHDPDYRLTLDQTRRTLDIYEKALSDLQAL